jgi:hypothetical protein
MTPQGNIPYKIKISPSDAHITHSAKDAPKQINLRHNEREKIECDDTEK